MTTHYVDNKQFYDAIVEYRAAVADALLHKKPKPRIPEYIGECIFMIASRLATKPNFANYSYKDDMVADGIENCICYIDNFDPAKSTNPFAYFTQIIYFAFLKRLQKEKKQTYIKHKAMQNASIFIFEPASASYTQSDANDEQVPMGDQASFQHAHDFIKSFEDELLKKKTKRKEGIEKLMVDDV